MAIIRKLKAVDFFCCAGGVTSGFRKAGIQVLGGIDIDKTCKETYEKNNMGAKFIEADIAKLSPRSLHKKLGIRKNMDNLVFVGCSPCQYYTNMQTNKTKSKNSKMLLEEFKRFVDYYNPGYLFIENVPGLDTKEGSPLSEFKKFLQTRAISYVFDEAIINAADYNVPQNRKRYILIATRLSKQIEIPKKGSKNVKTVKDVIGNMPKVPAAYKDGKKLKHWTAKLELINLTRIQHTSHNGGCRLEWKHLKNLQLKCYEGKDRSFPDVYGRMFWNKPSPTITTKFFSISNGRFGHPEQDRAISIREGALLQSFDKSYNFYSQTVETIARMIGNAVPPLLAKHIGKTFIKSYMKVHEKEATSRKTRNEL